MVVALGPQRREEVWFGGDEAGVADVGLDDHRGQLGAAVPEELHHRPSVVKGEGQRQRRELGGDARAIRESERRHPAPRLDEKAVRVPVIAPLELEQGAPPRRGAGEPDRGHRRLGAGIHEPDPLERRHASAHVLGEFHLRRARRPVGPARRRSCIDRREHGGMRVAEDQRAPGADVVEVRLPVHVGEAGAGSLGHEKGRPAHRPERPHRRIHPAGKHRFRSLEELLRAAHVSATARKS